MNKTKYIVVIITVIIFLALIFYNSSISVNDKQPLDQKKEIYMLIFDAIITQDKGLNYEMKYISIDSNVTKELNQEESNELLNYLKKYNVEVINYSFNELKELGMFDEETLSLEGILLEIKQFKVITSNRITIEAVKYRSGLGAIGMEYTLLFDKDKWVIKQEKMLWIS